MQPSSEAQLLREYAELGIEAAFAELVARHTDLVYSTALRQTGCPDVAAEVAQEVFVALARGAQRLTPRLAEGASLAGWLCRSARNLSLNHRRAEFRRSARERLVMQDYYDPIVAAEPDWQRLGPALDEAMSELDDSDHDALVLRFFKNQDLRAVGAALGVSDDAAQKRVARALEKLRHSLGRRGIATTTAALAALISTHAVQAAPAGLAAALSTAALAAVSATTATATATTTLVMTTFQKTLIAATLAVAAGTGIYQHHQTARLRDQVQLLQQQQAPLAEQIQQLERERDAAANTLAAAEQDIQRLRSARPEAELLKLRGDVARWRSAANDPAVSSIRPTLENVSLLKQRLEQTPGASIPELRFLTEEDWLNAARGSLSTEEDYRRAFARLRTAAEQAFAPMLQAALRQYLQANHGQFPTDPRQLQSFFKTPVEDALLQRWQIVPAEEFPNLGVGSKQVLTSRPVDEDYDSCTVLGPDGSGWSDFKTQKAFKLITPALQAYEAAHSGQHLVDANGRTDLSLLKPYLETPDQLAALEILLKAQNSP